MNKLLLTILSFFIMMGTAYAIDFESLKEKIMAHPDVLIGIHGTTGVKLYTLRMKEDISGHEFDWRWDIHTIHVSEMGVSVAVHRYQDSGNVPDSAWVVVDKINDLYADGVMDFFYRDRYLSVICSDSSTGYCQLRPFWPDGRLKYPEDDVNKEKQKEIYEHELMYWQNTLQ